MGLTEVSSKFLRKLTNTFRWKYLAYCQIMQRPQMAEKQQLRILQRLDCEIRLFPGPIQIVILYLNPSSNISVLFVYI